MVTYFKTIPPQSPLTLQYSYTRNVNPTQTALVITCTTLQITKTNQTNSTSLFYDYNEHVLIV